MHFLFRTLNAIKIMGHFFLSQITESQLRADLLRMKIAHMKRKEKE
jgi:hypothetical protein